MRFYNVVERISGPGLKFMGKNRTKDENYSHISLRSQLLTLLGKHRVRRKFFLLQARRPIFNDAFSYAYRVML